MSNQEPRQSRATTHIKFYAEKWLWGSSRSELTPEERSVFVDFLCMAATDFGTINCSSRKQTASQLFIEEELLNRSIDKFIQFEKIIPYQKKKGRGELFEIVNWDKYQADYLKKREKRAEIEKDWVRCDYSKDSDADIQPTLDNTKLRLFNTFNYLIINRL